MEGKDAIFSLTKDADQMTVHVSGQGEDLIRLIASSMKSNPDIKELLTIAIEAYDYAESKEKDAEGDPDLCENERELTEEEEAEREVRLRIIGQNGNTGEHYEDD